jgi:hypothetical protein
MNSQLRQLLHWQLRFQSRAIVFWLVSGGYLLLAGPGILWVLERMDSSRVPITGRHYFNGLLVIHWILTPGFALFRSSATVSDRAEGVLSLVKITNLPALQWTLYRVLTLILEFLPIWALRLPFYFYAYCLGGRLCTENRFRTEKQSGAQIMERERTKNRSPHKNWLCFDG